MASARDTAPPIGPIIQRHRRARHQTLDGLARVSGVSKSMLSQIERGEANPTFAVLWSVTRALGLDFADLTAGNAAPPPPAIETVASAAVPEMRGADGKSRLRILSPPKLAGATEWYEIEIAPGGTLASAPHTAGAEEHLTCWSGAFTVTSGAATVAIKPGETARYASDVRHVVANRGGKPARGLLVVLFR